MSNLDRLQIPDYITNPEFLGFPAAMIYKVIKSPDHRGEVAIDGAVQIRLYQRTTPYSTDIVLVSETGQNGPHVPAAIRLFSDFCEETPRDVPPLNNVRAFAERFGLELVIAGKSGRFFICERIAVSSPLDPTKLIEVKNPENHNCVWSTLVKPTESSVEIAVAFCTDATQYRQWIESH